MRDISEASLDAWMARLSNGDRSAFEPLFRALQPRALRFARARLETGADDVAQTALLKVFTHAHRFVAGRPALPWFYAIVANEIRSARQQTRRHLSLDDGLPALAGEDDEATLLRGELLRALEQAIASLDDAAAAAIRAQLGEVAPPAIDSATFRKRVSRAYGRLRLLLGEFR